MEYKLGKVCARMEFEAKLKFIVSTTLSNFLYHFRSLPGKKKKKKKKNAEEIIVERLK